jgi:lysophospholipase L1-like esterase
MFEQEYIDTILAFYATYPRYAEVVELRKLQPLVGHVDNLFYGDSITAGFWQLYEHFPNHSLLNRGIGGDNVYGLYYRVKDDVFPYTPKRVFMLIGINHIGEPEERITSHILALADMMREKGIEVGLSSILPLREEGCMPELYQHQDKIVRINTSLEDATKGGNGLFYVDYHSALKDSTGQLAAECATEDGLHITFEAYNRMAEVVRPLLAK